MRTSIAITAWACCFALTSGNLRAEELFSKVALDDVFTSSTSTSGTALEASPTVAGRDQILGIGSLVAALRTAGYEPQQKSDQVVLVKLQRGAWDLPVVLTISADAQELWMTMLLAEQAEGSTPAADKLRGLLAANRDHAPLFFGYSDSRRRAELYQVIAGRRLTASELAARLEQMAGIAEKTQILWDFAGKAASTPETPASAPKAPEKTASDSLVGTWSASVSDKTAFALQLSSDGKFVLVHVNDGKTNRSTGSYTLENQQLTLVGDDGSKLPGTLSGRSPSEFRFQPASGSPLLFKRAK